MGDVGEFPRVAMFEDVRGDLLRACGIVGKVVGQNADEFAFVERDLTFDGFQDDLSARTHVAYLLLVRDHVLTYELSEQSLPFCEVFDGIAVTFDFEVDRAVLHGRGFEVVLHSHGMFLIHMPKQFFSVF